MALFERETDLVSSFKIHSRKFLNEICNKSISRYFIISEFDSYVGVADIIIGTYRPYLSRKNQRESINLNWVKPLQDFLLGQVFSFEDFKKRYNLSSNSARLWLDEYVDAGFISKNKQNIYLVKKEYEFITDNVIAIEAKLKNWRKALSQANRYRKFSDFSFVLLDESNAKAAIRNITLFKENNIGLITMNKESYQIHVLPEVKNFKKDVYSLRVNEAAYEHFVATI